MLVWLLKALNELLPNFARFLQAVSPLTVFVCGFICAKIHASLGERIEKQQIFKIYFQANNSVAAFCSLDHVNRKV